MCLLCEIVHGKYIDETECYRDPAVIIVMDEDKNWPLVIWHDHVADPFEIFKQKMRRTALTKFPGYTVQETEAFGEEHYCFHLKPPNNKKG